MVVWLNEINDFEKENNLGNNIIEASSFLGILSLNINENKKHWEIIIKGPRHTPYQKGTFTLTIDFPDNFPQNRPEIRFKNKIYHLDVSPSNGHIDVAFLNNWYPKTSIVDILVGIYLFFIRGNNPHSSYSNEKAREYQTNREEFNRKAEEWSIKYSTLFISKEKDNIENIQKEKINELENKNTLLSEKVKELKLKKEDIKNNINKDKIIKLLEEIEELKIKRPIEILPNEKLITVIFQSQEFIYSIICKDTDIFAKIESKLYEKFPKYKESEQYFIVNGKKVNRFNTLKENGIKYSDIIIMQKCEF